MFSKIFNEAVINFEMETESPLFIKSGEEDSLNPTTAINTYLTFYRNGKYTPVIPGTSFKGVFRSRAEKILNSTGLTVCDIFDNSCGKKIKNKEKNLKRDKAYKHEGIGTKRYEESCSACKVFGSTVLRSRVDFEDAYPKENYKIGKRKAVAIDRISGSYIESALFDFEYVEFGIFDGKIRLKNFFPWQIKLLLNIFKDINEGYVTFGGLTSKGFGRMKVTEANLKLKYYDKSKKIESYTDEGFYIEKNIIGIENINKCFEKVYINEAAVKRSELKDEPIL